MDLDLWLIKITSCPAAQLFVDSAIPAPSPIWTAFWDTEYTQSSLPLYAPASAGVDITELSIYISALTQDTEVHTPFWNVIGRKRKWMGMKKKW